MSDVMQKEVVRRLVAEGGTDIVIHNGRIYELSVRELDPATVRQAVRNILDQEKTHDPESA
jgi:hypothetical protein